MNTRLVLWGEIGTDRKALVALYLEEETAKIHIYAFPKEIVTKEVQDALFVEWKNGGEYEFPDNAIHWEVDANSDTILPENLKVERPEVILQSQHKWSKKLMGSKINQLLTDETRLLEEKASTISEYDQSLWEKAKAQWEKISSYQKKNEISWEQTTVLKEKINAVFDTLKAVKRINNENEDQANSVLLKQYQKRVEDLQSKLIYSDQWKFIFDDLKKIQAELKDIPFRWNHKRNLYSQVNVIYDDLRKYRMTEVISKTKGRISQLQKILDGLKDSIARDHENYNMQVEKMQHYTRGKLSVEDIQSRFSYIFDRIKEKEQKADGIKQTIAQLHGDIEKEKKQQEEREQQRIKREQEEEEKAKEREKKGAETKAVKTEAAKTENPETETAKKRERKRKPREVAATGGVLDENKVEDVEVEEKVEVNTERVNEEIKQHEEKPEVEEVNNGTEVESESSVEKSEQMNKELSEEKAGPQKVKPAENKDSKDAEKILSENNADLEPVIEVEPATSETVKSSEDTPSDEVEEQIAKITEKAKNNPD